MDKKIFIIPLLIFSFAFIAATPASEYLVYKFSMDEPSPTIYSFQNGYATISSNTSVEFQRQGIVNKSVYWSSTSGGYFNPNFTLQSFEDLGNFSISLWWKPEPFATGYTALFSSYRAGGVSRWLMVNETGFLHYFVCASACSEILMSNQSLDINKWNNILVTVSSSVGREIYLNGELIGKDSEKRTISSDSFYIAMNAQGGNRPKGYMDEFLIFNQTLNKSTAEAIFNDGITLLPPNIDLSYPINYYNISKSSLAYIDFNASIDSGGFSQFSLVNVSIYIDGILNETNTSGLNGLYEFKNKQLLEGEHNWSIIAVNNNSISTESDIRKISINFTYPTASIESPTNLSNLTYSNVTFNFSFSPGNDEQSITNATLYIDNTENETQTSISDNYIVFYKILSDGIHSWYLTLFNNDFKSSNSEINTLTIDSKFPLISSLSPENYYNLTTTNPEIIFEINVSDAQAITNVSLYLDGELNETNTSGINGLYQFNKILNFGEHNWSILIYDNDSNFNWTEERFLNIIDERILTDCKSSGFISGETYILQNNISISGDCFYIDAQDVTLDLNGYTINGDGTGTGLYIDYDNITVKNGIFENFQDGIILVNEGYNAGNNFINISSNSNINYGIWLDYGAEFNNFIGGEANSNGVADIYNDTFSYYNYFNDFYVNSNLYLNEDFSLINECKPFGYLSGETYYLQNDINSDIQGCFQFDVNNVTLDLNGYSIIQSANDYAIKIDSIENITIQNGTITNFGTAIYGTYNANNKFYNLIFIDNTDIALDLEVSDENILENLTITGGINWAGIYLYESSNCIFNNITSNLNGEAGIEVDGADNNYFTNIITNNNYEGYDPDAWGIGLYQSNNNIFINITSIGNSYGIHTNIGGGAGSFNNTFINIVANSSLQADLISDISSALFINYTFTTYDFGSTGNDLEFGNNEGQVYFVGLTGSGTDLMTDLVINNNYAFADSTANLGFNVTSNITLNNMPGFLNPIILKDGIECLDCINFTSLNDPTVKFQVPGWSEYEIGEAIIFPAIITLLSPATYSNQSNLTGNFVAYVGTNQTDIGITNVSLIFNGAIVSTNTSGIVNDTYYFSNNLINATHSSYFDNWSIIAYTNYSIPSQSQTRYVKGDISPPYLTVTPANVTQFYDENILVLSAYVYTAFDTGTNIAYFSSNDSRWKVQTHFSRYGHIMNTTSVAVGNYEINVTIFDSLDNAIYRPYRITINQSVKPCNVYVNDTTKFVWTDCSSDYVLTVNNTPISNASTITLGAGYYNLTVQRNDAENYTYWTDTEFLTIPQVADPCSIYSDKVTPQIYPNSYTIYTDCTSDYTLTKDGTPISNGTTYNLGIGTSNFTVQRTDDQNYTNIYDSVLFTITPNPSLCQVLFDKTSPLNYPDTFTVWSNCDSLFTLMNNGVPIVNNSVQALNVGTYNFSVQRTDTENYTNTYSDASFIILEQTEVRGRSQTTEVSGGAITTTAPNLFSAFGANYTGPTIDLSNIRDFDAKEFFENFKNWIRTHQGFYIIIGMLLVGGLVILLNKR